MKVKSLIAVFGLICLTTGGLMYLPLLVEEDKVPSLTCDIHSFEKYHVLDLLVDKLKENDRKINQRNIKVINITNSHDLSNGKTCRAQLKVTNIKWVKNILMDYRMIYNGNEITVEFSRFNEI